MTHAATTSTGGPAGVAVRRFRPAAGQDGADRAQQVVLLTMPPATGHVFEQHAGERICVLLDGSADLLIGTESTTIARGAVIHSRSGGAFTVTNTGESAIELLLLAAPGPANTAATDPEVAVAAQVECFSLFDVTDEVLHRPEAGFFHMRTRMLLTASNGYRSFIFGQSTFEPGTGIHVLHRHVGADEMFYVWDGEGSHLEMAGTEHPMRPGDAVFVPRGDWHGFRNGGDRPVRAFFGLIGAGDIQQAGNEVLDNDEAIGLAAGPTIMMGELADQD